MSRIVLRQFLLATALIALYWTLSSWGYMTAHPHFAERSGGVVRTLLLGLPKTIFSALPIAAAVAMALVPIAPGAFRQGMLLAGTVTALFVVSDLVARPLWNALDRAEMGTDNFDSPRANRFDDTTGALGGTVAHLLGRVRAEDIQRWPPDTTKSSGYTPITDPRVIIRISAISKYRLALELLDTLIASGLVLGLGIWLRRIATFRSDRDERVLRLTLGWVLAIACILAPPMLLGGMYYTFSSPNVSLLWLAAPTVVLGIPSLLGWRAAYRLDRLGAA